MSTKKYLLLLSEEEHRGIRIKAAQVSQTMRAYILEAIYVRMRSETDVTVPADIYEERKSTLKVDESAASNGTIPLPEGACPGRFHTNPDESDPRRWLGGAGSAPRCFDEEECQRGDAECLAAQLQSVLSDSGRIEDCSAEMTPGRLRRMRKGGN